LRHSKQRSSKNEHFDCEVHSNYSPLFILLLSRFTYAIPESSILGVGCDAPVNFADIKEGEVVVDIGSGGGIDVFLSASKVKDSGKVIGIDMTDEMLEKTRNNSRQNGFSLS
jgi:tRNA1(Val) A37 N6-methylase TrmN6